MTTILHQQDHNSYFLGTLSIDNDEEQLINTSATLLIRMAYIPQRIGFAAIPLLATPTNVKELQRVLGLNKYVGKFLPNLSSEITLCQRWSSLIPHDSVGWWRGRGA